MTTFMIVTGKGMGGFLNPPGHAEHTQSVHEYERGRDRGSMSLSYAAGDETTWVPADFKARCKQALADNPGQFTDEWERVVYSYFRNCYSPDGVTRNTSNATIGKNVSLPAEWHLAYMHVRHYFPDAKPRLDLIADLPKDYGTVNLDAMKTAPDASTQPEGGPTRR